MKSWTDQHPSLPARVGCRLALRGSVAVAIVLQGILPVYIISAAPQLTAEQFAEMANRGPVRDDDCVGYGGKVLIREDYDVAIKNLISRSNELDTGNLVEHEGAHYVTYAVDNTGWLAWLIGIRKYSLGLCVFEAGSH